MDLRCFEDPKRKMYYEQILKYSNIRNILFKLLNLETYKGMGKDLLYKAYLVELFVYINTQLFHNSKASIEIKKAALLTKSFNI